LRSKTLPKKFCAYITKSEAIHTITAVIDIGSNTIRLLIARRESNGIIRLYSDRQVTRLGADLISTGNLNRINIDISLSCLSQFKAKCEAIGVTTIHAIGTSALREAVDSALFIDKVRKNTGLDVQILTGEDEALLTLKGIAGLCHHGPVLAIDIGGGSTELILSTEPPLKFSVPVGALKLHQQFISIDPPSLPQINRMKESISKSLGDVLSTIRSDSAFKNACVVITGGTPTTLAAIKMGMTEYDGDRLHGFKMSHSDIKSLFTKMVSMPLADRVKLPGMEPERGDIIIPGTLIVLCIMETLSIPEITVSDYGLMEGIALTWD
jgi:exopolyphosphatase / guanosine-5'-triphosphate,3'-diphosphate pyrophosphatase